MATLLPPPKRQKVYNGIPEPEKIPVEQSPNVVVQFVSEDDGSALAPAVSLPANVSREDLQSLVNRLTSKVCVQHLLPILLIPHHLARMMTLYLFNFMSRYRQTLPLRNPRGLSSRNRSRPTCFRILPAHLHQRISSSSIVRPSLCSASDRPRGVLLLCQVKSSLPPSICGS